MDAKDNNKNPDAIEKILQDLLDRVKHLEQRLDEHDSVTSADEPVEEEIFRGKIEPPNGDAHAERYDRVEHERTAALDARSVNSAPPSIVPEPKMRSAVIENHFSGPTLADEALSE